MFRDRQDAGRQLAGLLVRLDLADPVVVALPRGGVPVGVEVAAVLGAPLDVLVARKLGAPHHPEYGIGAIAEGGVLVVTDGALRALGISSSQLARIRRGEEAELGRRVRQYRSDRPMVGVRGRDVVLVDDGLATGVTASAAVEALRAMAPNRIVLAVPVASPDTAARFESLVDDVVCVARPQGFRAVGQFYEEFDQVSDAEVLDLLGPSVEDRRSSGG